MKKTTLALGALAMTAGAATAGGVERSVTGPGILFENGNYMEFSFSQASPKVSGNSLLPVPVAPGVTLPAGAPSGDMANSYTNLSFGIKKQLNDKLDLAFLMNQPIGADVTYAAGTGYLYGGSNAVIKSQAMTALLRYKINDNVSVYGGVTAERAEGNVALFNGYTMSTTRETDFGYIVGAAYEKPEIAMRIALTYTSAITHDFDAVELTPLGPVNTTFESEVPQSIALDFQTGVAKDTLVFGSVRWREWSAFDITPVAFAAGGGGSLVSYDDDTTTFTLGVGRRFSENWAGAIQISHEKSHGGFSGNLGPTDGYTSVGLGMTYTKDNMKISGGVTYAWLGDARTEAPAALGAPAGTAFGDFRDNTTMGVGIKVGFSF
jgi:long-subunit fatty acid transport protein